MSAHKIHGAKGVGALYIRKGSTRPLIFGGGQESGYRREPRTPGIRGFGVACDIWAKRQGRGAHVSPCSAGIRRRAESSLKPSSRARRSRRRAVHSPLRSPIQESVLHALEGRNVFVSTGSACSSHKRVPALSLWLWGEGRRGTVGHQVFHVEIHYSRRYIMRSGSTRGRSPGTKGLEGKVENTARRKSHGGSTASQIR